MTDTIPNSLWVPRLLRIFAWSTVSLTLLFLVNNYLIFWKGWPGLWKFFAHHQLFGIPPLREPLSPDSLVLGSIQLCVLISIKFLILIFVFKTPNQRLIDDANILTRFAAYLTRACFWAVLIVGFVDIIISFMRVEGFLNSLFGNAMAIDLGRSVFRGTYVHYPLIILSFVIAFFVRGHGFTWLALLVVVAEFQIVISRVV